MLDKFLTFFQKPTTQDANEYIVTHRDYTTQPPIEHKQKFFELPIARNVINQKITSKVDFIDFINAYSTDSTKLFYTTEIIKAVFNYSTKEKADYGDSICSMPLDKTRDFDEFQNHIEQDLSQKQFIRILKRMEPYIIAFDDKLVDDMDIIEIAEHLQATKNINSVQRNTHQAFVIDAEIKAGNSNMTIPRFITFKMPIFQNDLEMEAEFRVELFLSADDRGFIANLVCYKLEQTIDEAVRKITTSVQLACSNIPSYMV